MTSSSKSAKVMADALKTTNKSSSKTTTVEGRPKSAEVKKFVEKFQPHGSNPKQRPNSDTDNKVRSNQTGGITKSYLDVLPKKQLNVNGSSKESTAKKVNFKTSTSECPQNLLNEKQKQSTRNDLTDGINSGKSYGKAAIDSPDQPKALTKRRTSKFGMKVTQVLTQVDFSKCDPSTCVSVMRIPSLKSYSALLRQLKNCQKSWLEGFLEERGLEVLLEGLEVICQKKVQLAEAMMLLECVACVKAIMNCRQGLELFTVNKDYCKSLIKALDSTNVGVKKQVFDLMAALCASSEEGFRSCLEAVESFKVIKYQRHRFSFMVNELKNQLSLDYTTSVLAFVNCLIDSYEDVGERAEIRNEFIGLNILEIIEALRTSDHEDLEVQCEVFAESKQSDDEAIAQDFGVPDGTDHKALFGIIYEKVYNKPEEVILLNILQKLIRIDSEDEQKFKTWEVIDKFIAKVLHSDNPDDILRQLQSDVVVQRRSKEVQTDRWHFESTNKDPTPVPKIDSEATKKFKKVLEQTLSNQKKESAKSNTEEPTSPSSTEPSKAEILPQSDVPIPPPLPGFSLQSIPPSASPLLSSTIPLPPPPPPVPGSLFVPPPPPAPGSIHPPLPPFVSGTTFAPPPPPAPGVFNPPPPPCPSAPRSSFIPLAQSSLNISSCLAIPTPKVKIKNFNWSKVSNQEATKRDIIWSSVLDAKEPSQINYDKVEELFSRKVATVQATPQTKMKQNKVINLIDMRKSMAIDIWLRQFKMPHDEVVEKIKTADTTKIDIEQARELVKILPESSEIEQIKNFEGDRNNLGSAEKFIEKLVQVPHYVLRLELMTAKLDFLSTFESSSSKQEAFLTMCDGIVNSESFKHFLRLVLQIGNFLNVGSYAGNAAGFRISSLTKLRDTQSNQRGVTLLHHIVSTAPNIHSDSLDFLQELYDCVQSSSRLSVEKLNLEVTKLSTNLNNLSKQLGKCSDDNLKERFQGFFEDVDKKLGELMKRQQNIEAESQKLCTYLCEDAKTFKLEECALILFTFFEQVKSCIKENEQRKLQEEKMERRKKEREASLKKTPSKQGNSLDNNKDEECLIDRLLEDIRKGTTLKQRKKPICHVGPMGNFSKTRERTGDGAKHIINITDDSINKITDTNSNDNQDECDGPMHLNEINSLQKQIDQNFTSVDSAFADP